MKTKISLYADCCGFISFYFVILHSCQSTRMYHLSSFSLLGYCLTCSAGRTSHLFEYAKCVHDIVGLFLCTCTYFGHTNKIYLITANHSMHSYSSHSKYCVLLLNVLLKCPLIVYHFCVQDVEWPGQMYIVL